eukprot:6640531-Prymnesium_polylepis.5
MWVVLVQREPPPRAPCCSRAASWPHAARRRRWHAVHERTAPARNPRPPASAASRSPPRRQ